MTIDHNQANWWELHVRQARGEQLSEADLQRYNAELARQDSEDLLRNNIEALKTMRASVAALAEENAQLRARIEVLEKEIQGVEQALSRQTRELLGVPE